MQVLNGDRTRSGLPAVVVVPLSRSSLSILHPRAIFYFYLFLFLYSHDFSPYDISSWYHRGGEDVLFARDKGVSRYTIDKKKWPIESGRHAEGINAYSVLCICVYICARARVSVYRVQIRLAYVLGKTERIGNRSASMLCLCLSSSPCKRKEKRRG